MGIERLVFFMGYPWSLNPTPAEFRRQNDQVIEALQHWSDRALGFAYLNPNFADESLDELNRCVRDGPLVGVKLWVATRCSEARLDPIVHRASELQAVIFQHTWRKAGGNLAGESSPEDLAQLAARHPRATFICGHAGGDWEWGIRAVRSSPRVWIGLGGSDPTAGMVEMAVRELGADRILYGSDVGGRSFASQLAKVEGADIPLSLKRKILGENLKRLLTPILMDKGIKP
jgi:predicted TIM-barrel fold metal-dependent hydrolase